MGRFKIVDVVDEQQSTPKELQKDPLPREFGLQLDTLAKARQWLTNPHNWHESNTYIVKWDGLVPTVSRHHGQRLVNEPWDDGLPEVVVREQIRLRRGGKQENTDAQGEEP